MLAVVDERDGQKRVVIAAETVRANRRPAVRGALQQVGEDEPGLELVAEDGLPFRHALKVTCGAIKVIINDEIREWRDENHDGDTVSFIIPLSGG